MESIVTRALAISNKLSSTVNLYFKWQKMTNLCIKKELFYIKKLSVFPSGQVFLSWAFSDKADDYNLDENIHEDAKSRKRRIQTELSRALAVLGVKHSTFYSMLSSGRHSQVKEMLKVALQERSDNVINLRTLTRGS